jgi:hypothetical protein
MRGIVAVIYGLGNFGVYVDTGGSGPEQGALVRQIT